MQHRWTIAGVIFIIVGLLELAFFGLSVVGVLTGGLMGVFGLMESESETAFVGAAVFIIYGLWFLCTLVPMALHLVTGVLVVMGKRKRGLVWAATISSVMPVFTVYCAPTSLVAAAAGLIALLVQDPPDLAAG